MKQLFISHTWLFDETGRDTHARARNLREFLVKHGWSVWFDELDMSDNLDSAMAKGIDEAEAVIMLLTRKYARKINHAANRTTSNDNCLKEFGYTLFREKLIIPVVFEEAMRDSSGWSPGIFPLRMCMSLYVDGAGDLSVAAERIHASLMAHDLRPQCTPPRILMRKRSKSTPHYRGFGREGKDVRILFCDHATVSSPDGKLRRAVSPRAREPWPNWTSVALRL